MEFKPRVDIRIPQTVVEEYHLASYKYDYERIFRNLVEAEEEMKVRTYRTLILSDLFFIVYFVMQVEGSNHPFVVNFCKEIEEGPETRTLDLAARGHFKSTIITTAKNIQTILKDKEARLAIFSHTRPAAKSFLRRIKLTLESSDLLKKCFPDVLYMNPQAESPKWSEDDGIIVRRKGFYNEATLEAWGLIEGMPTGKHFTDRTYDDIETPDMVTTPDVMQKLKSSYDVSHNLSDKGGRYRVVGTPYHHAGLIQYLRDEKLIDGTKKYLLRLRPATVDGTPNGFPVYLSQEELDVLKTSEHFNAQQLLDPTPSGTQELNPDFLKELDPEFIPSNLVKFMVIDPAGDSKDGKGDAWGIFVCGVEAKRDDIGAANVYITHGLVSPLSDSEAIEQIVRIYMSAGLIMQIGVEKVGLSSVEVHVANALKAKGRHVSIENDSLVLLRPAGRKKTERITSALAWPLNNGKLHISRSVNNATRQRLKDEMMKFPFWHDDGLDALSYLYDMIKDFRFINVKSSSDMYGKVKGSAVTAVQKVAGY